MKAQDIETLDKLFSRRKQLIRQIISLKNDEIEILVGNEFEIRPKHKLPHTPQKSNRYDLCKKFIEDLNLVLNNELIDIEKQLEQF